MGILVAVEGLDGAGKRTVVEGALAEFARAGVSARTFAFPRYRRSVAADIAAEALRGGHAGLAESRQAMALLFAFDRMGAADELCAARDAVDVVLLDRYVASNAAYGAARAHQRGDGEFARWIGELEFDRLGLPEPDLQVLLDVAPALAAGRAQRRGEHDASRVLDTYERDRALQERTAEVYRQLAEMGWRGPWWVYRAEAGQQSLAQRITGLRVLGHTGAQK
jgi:dTMP kinase